MSQKARKPRVDAPFNLKDTDVLFPSLECSDHVLIIINSEHIFSLLKSLIVHSLPKSEIPKINISKENFVKFQTERAEDFFTGYGPLSTAASNIKFAYLIGALDDNSFKALEIIRSIRNETAHSRTEVKLRHPRCLALIEELQKLLDTKLKISSSPCALKFEGGSSAPIQIDSARMAFVIACTMLIGKLRGSFKTGKLGLVEPRFTNQLLNKDTKASVLEFRSARAGISPFLPNLRAIPPQLGRVAFHSSASDWAVGLSESARALALVS